MKVYENSSVNKGLIYTTPSLLNSMYSKMYFNNFAISICNKKYYCHFTKHDVQEFIQSKTRVIVTNKVINNNIKIPYLSMIVHYNTSDNLQNHNFIHNNGNVIFIGNYEGVQSVLLQGMHDWIPLESVGFKLTE